MNKPVLFERTGPQESLLAGFTDKRQIRMLQLHVFNQGSFSCENFTASFLFTFMHGICVLPLEMFGQSNLRNKKLVTFGTGELLCNLCNWDLLSFWGCGDIVFSLNMIRKYLSTDKISLADITFDVKIVMNIN
jgi:hypothetical protein